MISELRLKNFKAFKDLELELRSFNLLSGLNSVGKSTILQSLLVLRQSYLEAEESERTSAEFPLQLNGDYIELGDVQDVFYRARGRETTDNILAIGIEDTVAGDNEWQYARRPNVDFFDNATFLGNASRILDTSLFSTSGKFQYIQAERIGPRVYTSTSDSRIARRDLGKAGEYTIHYLNQHQDDRIPYEELLFEDSDGDNRLIDQVIKWMGTISPNTVIETEVNRELGVSRLVIDDYRATNVGFGISYVLPVIVAILSSSKEDILLLENPEAHLHPQGQAQMGILMARAAAAGIQIICETHSDHILNGVRYATKAGFVTSEQITIHHFAIEEGKRQHYQITVHEDGDLTPWPSGFFDEFEKMLMKLV